MNHLPTLRQLRYLVALAEEAHFGRAAANCFVTQSTLSAGIKELEEILDTRLVERTKRSVMVTPLGEEITHRARRIISEAEGLAELAASSRKPLVGDLRFGVIPTIGPFLLPRVLPELRATFPELKLYLREEQTLHLLELLSKGHIEVVLMALPYEMRGVETHLLVDDPFFVGLPRSHALAARKSLSPEELDPETLLLLEDGHCLRAYALSACQLVQGPVRRALEATSLHTLVQMVDFGLGVTLLPKLAVDGGVLRGTDIEIRPLTGKLVSRQIGLVWRKTSGRGREFRLLGECLRDTINSV